MPQDAQALADIAAEHGVELFIQFGPTVSGREHEGSDVDIGALLQDESPSLDRELALASALQPLFPERDVDLVIVNRADPLLLHHIVEGGRLLFGSARRFQELRIYAYKVYQDHQRFFEMERAYVRRRLAQVKA